MRSIHIFGAGSGIGKWFAEKVCSRYYSVYAYDTDEKIIDLFKTSDNITGVYLDEQNSPEGDYFLSCFGYVAPTDIILVAVPEAAFPRLFELMNKHLVFNCHVGIMSSRQMAPLALAQSSLTYGICFGLHPLFGPTLSVPHGQTVALCKPDNISLDLDHFIENMNDVGLLVTEITPEKHDEYMTYVQALTHFSLLNFFAVIAKSDASFEDLLTVKTPPFQFMSAFASRILMGSPSTYAAIQKTDSASLIRRSFVETAQELANLENDHAYDAFIKKIEDLREPISGTTLDEYSQFSLLAVSAAQDRERFFFRMKDKNNLVVFSTRQTKTLRVGKICEIDGTNVTIKHILTEISDENGKNWVPMPLNDSAKEQYSEAGVNIRFSQPQTIKKGSIRLPDRDRADEWIENNILRITRNVSLTNPRNLPHNIIENWLPEFIPQLKKCTVLQEHKRSGTLAKLTLKIVYLPTISRNTIERRLRLLCYGGLPSS